MTAVHFCTAHDLHPYECDGPGECIHCDQRPDFGHNPTICPLCHYGEADENQLALEDADR